MTNSATLSPEHADYLRAHAVDPELAARLGVRTVTTRADMEATGDDNWVNFANFPAILFPWTSPDGEVMYQARPDDPTLDPKTKKPRKYVFGRGQRPVLWAVREVKDPRVVVIIEGTKQCLAGATHAPDDVSVYGIAGCRMWQINGVPIPDLYVVEDRPVVVILDADAATNPEVYDAGAQLAAALASEGATSVNFGRLVGGAAKSGLDDILAGRPENRRAMFMTRVIRDAKPKPSDAKPKPRKKAGTAPTGEGGRVTIVVNHDRYEVINNLTQALLDLWNARVLFNHGGVISRRTGSTMAPVDRGAFHDLVQSTAVTVNEVEGANGTTYSFSWPDAGTMAATMSRADQFATLDRLAHAPFVRPDGSVVTEPGYDEQTRTILMPDPVFEGIEVPDTPSPEQVQAARELILSDWLGDFPFETEGDRTNALALVVTPAIRGMVPRAPMAVVDGLQMGVGKNLLADSLLTVYTGRAAEPMNFVNEHEELRKQITSAFRTGAEFFVFDEAHELDGAPLAQALTAETWQDRILGVSTMAYFPNKVTWISLGNNVNVKGDITRRVYRIALRPTYANPQDRPSSSFRHPGQSGMDLGTWTRTNRRELMTAILTLVRNWFAIGSPLPSKGVSFGSFEAWERTVGGIVEAAGMTDFLGNLRVWRSDSDYDTQYWTAHLAWLREQFGTKTFRTAEVKTKALTIGLDNYAAPPRLDDPAERTYGKALGEAYGRIRSRRYGGMWLERMGNAHGHVSTYRVFTEEDGGPATHKPDPEVSTNLVEKPVDIPEPDPAPENEHAEARGPAPEDTDGEGHDEVRGPDCGPNLVPEGEVTVGFTDVDPQTMALITGKLTQNSEGLWSGLSRDVDTVTFDLETGDADDLYRTPGDRYVRIGATAADDGEVIPYTPELLTDNVYGTDVPRAVAADIRRANLITGHNIMAFDLPALVRAGALTMPEVHAMATDGRLFDGILAARYLDPPMARDKGVDAARKYDLGTLAVKHGLGEKYTDVSKPLAKKYGGDWGSIPIDVNDPDEDRAADAAAFIGYMNQDVELSRGLFRQLFTELATQHSDEAAEYLRREHRVAAIAAQISMNGMLVDQELLAQRVAEIEALKSKAFAYLHEAWGIPLTDAKGKAYASPLASKGGKAALEAALVTAGVPEKALWRTPTAGELQINGDAMKHYGAEYGQNNPPLRKLCTAVFRVVGARSVYQTATDNLMPDGRVHPKIGFDQATGRWSVTRPGLTVFGKRGGRHVERDIFLADPGEVFVSFDLSQVDMRAVAGLSQDLAYIEMLKAEDPHAELALTLFGDAMMRETAKPIGHGWNYGESLRRISAENDIEPKLVMQFDRMMRERFGRLVEWREEVRALAASGALLDNGFGRKMRPDPHRAHTQGPALMGQGAARDIMMTGLLNLPAEVLPMLRAQIHDEIVLSIPVDQVDEVSRAVIDALSFEWKGVPILADRSKAGTSWGSCYSKG